MAAESFNNFFNFIPTELSSAIVIFNIAFAFFLSLFIALVYRKTHHGLSYSSSFVSTLVILCILAAVVMMVVQNNLIGAFGLLGAFSLIRFRTIMKETKDISFVFFSLVVGVAIGTGNYVIAFFTTLLVSLIVLLFHYKKFGARFSDDFLLTALVANNFDTSNFENVFNKHLKSYRLVHIRFSKEGESSEYLYALNFESNKNADKLMFELETKNGVKELNMITAQHSVEY